MFCASIIFAQNFTLSSTELQGQLTSKQVFNGFGCTGENVSPQLSWKDAPKGTKSFAVTVYDPMHQQDQGGGIGLFLIFQKINLHFLLVLETVNQKMQFKVLQIMVKVDLVELALQ
jgi:hypothetical protein